MALRSKIAIITGAISGLGAGIAEYFAKEGAKLSLTGRNKDRLDEVATICQKYTSEDVIQTVGDITEDKIRQAVVQKTKNNFNKIDILVNNAGLFQLLPLIDVTSQVFDDVMNTNLKAPVLLTALAAPHLIESKGCVVNISSIAAKMSVSLDMFTRILARELAEHGVRVNSINSGYVRTRIFDSIPDRELVKDHLASVERTTPMARFGTPEEIARVAAFLASDKASFVTGESLVADGGRLLSTGM